MTAAVAEMMKSDKPYLLEVCVEKENNVFPMIPLGHRSQTSDSNNHGTEKLYDFDLCRKQCWIAIARVCNFLKRHINIDSLNTSMSEIENIFRFVIVAQLSKNK